MSSEELWDIYDRDRNNTGRTIARKSNDLLGKNDTTYLFSYLELFDRLLSEMLSVYMVSDFSVLRVASMGQGDRG